MSNVFKYWTADDFEISSYKYSLKQKIGKTFRTSGSDNTGLCTYTYNELGFRGDSIYAIKPDRNLAVFQKGGTKHSVSTINLNADYRISIQCFLNSDKKLM